MQFGGTLCDMKCFNFRFQDSWTNTRMWITDLYKKDHCKAFFFLSLRFSLMITIFFFFLWTSLFLDFSLLRWDKIPRPSEKSLFYPLDPNFVRKLARCDNVTLISLTYFKDRFEQNCLWNKNDHTYQLKKNTNIITPFQTVFETNI